MPRKLTLDSLKAELVSVKALLQSALDIDDPIGEMQYTHRKQELESKIRELEEQHHCGARLALFFGGKPVLGSLGINAGFAGPVLEKYQTIVSKVYSYMERGELGTRGKVAFLGDNDLMVTDLAKGSFGFVLEEADNQLMDTAVKAAVEHVSTMLQKCGSDSEDSFEEVIDEIDKRVLDALGEFFAHLHKSEASVRLVDDNDEFTLDLSSIDRACQRIKSTQIDEDTTRGAVTLIGFLPEHRRFEAKLPTGESIHGTATPEAAAQFHELAMKHRVLQQTWELEIQKRVFKARNAQERVSYKLIEFYFEEK